MSIDAIIDGILEREGGYVNDARDLGGETNFGITIRVARASGYNGAMRDLTRTQARDIYHKEYVLKPGFAAIIPIAPSVAEKLVDIGVNMGPGKAGEFLQIALNALNNQAKDYADIAEDGAVGPATIRALEAFTRKRGSAGHIVLLRAISCLQGARYIELSRMRAANETFVYGWLANRVVL